MDFEYELIPDANICIFRNVVDDSVISEILEAIEKPPKNGFDWSYMGDKGRDFWEDKNISPYEMQDFDIENIYAIEQAQKDCFNFYIDLIEGEKTDYRFTSFAVIHRWKPGTDMYAHRDRTEGAETIRYGFVFYVNDGYQGGEIHYPDYGISIKPERNMLVMHPGDILHGVHPVTEGIRVNMTAFAHVES